MTKWNIDLNPNKLFVIYFFFEDFNFCCQLWLQHLGHIIIRVLTNFAQKDLLLSFVLIFTFRCLKKSSVFFYLVSRPKILFCAAVKLVLVIIQLSLLCCFFFKSKQTIIDVLFWHIYCYQIWQIWLILHFVILQKTQKKSHQNLKNYFKIQIWIFLPILKWTDWL